MTFETRSSVPRTLPPKASSVHNCITVPGFTRLTGFTPPKVQASSEGSGRYDITSIEKVLPSVAGWATPCSAKVVAGQAPARLYADERWVRLSHVTKSKGATDGR